MFDTIDEAIAALTDGHRSEGERERAVHFIAAHPSDEAIAALVEGLRDEDTGVRWACGTALAGLGEVALRPLLKAIVNHGDDPRLRSAAHHALRSTTSVRVRETTKELLPLLGRRGSGIPAEEAAHRLLSALD